MFTWNIDSSPPCTETNKIQIDYEEQDLEEEEGTIKFTMAFRDTTYKEIKQNSAYDTKSLVGDVGGYIGLLLGYALIKLPGFLLATCVSMKTSISKAMKKFGKAMVHDINVEAGLRCGNKDTGKCCEKSNQCSNCIASSIKDTYSSYAVLKDQMQNIYEEFTEESETLKRNIQYIRNTQIAKQLSK